jgi:hypothetical protein
MARPRPPATAPVIPSNSLVASAVRLTSKSARIFNPNKGSWQADCYRHYRICGEAQYAANFMGNAVSRATLTVLDEDNKLVTSGTAFDALKELFNGVDGQSQMLADIGIHLTIAGECFLVGRQVRDIGDVWEIVSVQEIRVTGDKWFLTYTGDNKDVELTDSDVVIRIWNPMPGDRLDANSPFRALLPILTEIEWLTSHIFSQIRSRLLTAGILFLPSGMTFPPPPPVDGKEVEVANEAEGFMRVLAAGMEQALRREGLPAEIVPLVVTAPGDAIAQARLMEFWTELDAEAKELRSEAIRRFATGMSLPAEEILGMGSNIGTGGGNSNGVSHWGAWQIEESTIKMHVEPMLDTIVNAITVGYIRPLPGVNPAERIGYDTSALKLRPDRSKESIELYNLGLVPGEVVLRENGFDEIGDKAKDEDLHLWLLKKVASGSTTPEQVAQALATLGVPGIEAPAAEPGTDIVPTEERPPPSLEDHPERPRTPDESSLLLACDALVLRAMELAGKRAINAGLRGKDRDKTIEPTEFHLEQQITDCGSLLEGTFFYGPRVLGEQWQQIGKHLGDYCAALILSQTPHTKENLQAFLAQRHVVAPPALPAGQPLTLNLNIGGIEKNITLALPDNLVNVDLPDIQLDPQITLAPEITVQGPKQDAPVVNVTNQVETPSVTVNNDVKTPEVNVTNDVKTPEVNVTNDVQTPNVDVTVEAANVTVEPKIEVKPAPVKVMREKREKRKKTKVLRDSQGRISGTEEVE